MDRKLGGIALGALFLSGNAGALELLCEGQAVLGGTVGNTSFVFSMDDRSKQASAWTPEGIAYGTLEETQQHYRGRITAPSGNLFSMSIDRYSGDIFVVRVQPPPPDSKAAFWGTCRRAERKF